MFFRLLSLLQFYLAHMHPHDSMLNVLVFNFMAKIFQFFFIFSVTYPLCFEGFIKLKYIYILHIFCHIIDSSHDIPFNRFTFFSFDSIVANNFRYFIHFLLNHLHCPTSTLRSLEWLRAWAHIALLID